VSGERRVFGCLFWTFEFAILNLFRISDFEIRIWFRLWLHLWLRPHAALGLICVPATVWFR
jgi:hypothetical protein